LSSLYPNHVPSSKRGLIPLFYQSHVGSSLDLFNQSNLNLSYQSRVYSSPRLLESLNNPFNHSSLKPLNLFNLSNVRFGINPFYKSSHQSSTNLKSPNPFNLSSVQFGLNLFYQPSLRPQASSPPSNGGIYRGFIRRWTRFGWRPVAVARSGGFRWI
jgi:hypothetical protein